MKYISASYAYTIQGLQKDIVLSINDAGQIAAIEERKQAEQSHIQNVLNLPDTLLLPGFVNAHSHAFQRVLRGHTHRALSQHDTFWTWRNAMYAAAQRLTPDAMYETTLATYKEMVCAGYTTVGEFHYVHHQPGGQPYEHPNAMAEAVVSAAHDAGIQLVLLMTAYAQSGFAQPPGPEQQRFCDASVDAYLQRIDALRTSGVVNVGLAPHSVRAVPEAWLREIADYSRQYSLALHIHADEQQQEVEQCKAFYGCTPIELLERVGALGPLTTIVHATHATSEELALLAAHHCTVCVCPTTEGDLGDGIAPYAELMERDILLSIGSDSNTRLDPIEELRWAEYSARMRYQRRRVLVCERSPSPGPLLLDIGTHGGAVALRQETRGRLAPGMSADLIAINLKHPSLQGWTEEDMLDTLFFGASSEVVSAAWAAGKEVSGVKE